MTQQIVLTGYLGSDPQFLDTRERVIEREAFHPLAGKKVPQEFVVTPRRYARLSLATHEGRETRWHKLVAWNLDRGRDLYGVKIANKGDKVRVTAHEEIRQIQTPAGEVRELRELVVDRLEFLRIRVRHELP